MYSLSSYAPPRSGYLPSLELADQVMPNPYFAPPAVQYVEWGRRPAGPLMDGLSGPRGNPWEKVRRHTHESQCNECGYPIYVGDRGWWSDELELWFCCPACEERYRAARPNPYFAPPALQYVEWGRRGPGPLTNPYGLSGPRKNPYRCVMCQQELTGSEDWICRRCEHECSPTSRRVPALEPGYPMSPEEGGWSPNPSQFGADRPFQILPGPFAGLAGPRRNPKKEWAVFSRQPFKKLGVVHASQRSQAKREAARRWPGVDLFVKDPRGRKRRNPDVHPKAFEMRQRYREDLAAGHGDAAEYWRGQAAAYFVGNNPRRRRMATARAIRGYPGITEADPKWSKKRAKPGYVKLYSKGTIPKKVKAARSVKKLWAAIKETYYKEDAERAFYALLRTLWFRPDVANRLPQPEPRRTPRPKKKPKARPKKRYVTKKAAVRARKTRKRRRANPDRARGHYLEHRRSKMWVGVVKGNRLYTAWGDLKGPKLQHRVSSYGSNKAALDALQRAANQRLGQGFKRRTMPLGISELAREKIG